MNSRFSPTPSFEQRGLGALRWVTLVLVAGTAREAAAQTPLPGPYTSFNMNQYHGPMYYNPGYVQYGLPGVGVSPWNPIIQAQLNLGMRTARYNMYSVGRPIQCGRKPVLPRGSRTTDPERAKPATDPTPV